MFWPSLSERGQAFEPFKMLIGAIMALTVLVIIIGAVNYFDSLRLNVSKQRFFEGVENAAKQPNGAPLMIENIQLQEGDSFASSTLGKRAGIPGECIIFSASGSSSFSVSNESSLLTVNSKLLATAVVKCEVNPSSGCEVGCGIAMSESE